MEPEPITFGSLAPFVRDGKAYDIINNFGSPPLTAAQTLSTAGIYFTGYAFRVTNEGVYHVSVQYSTTAEAAVDIEYDGKVVASFDLPDSGGDAATTAETTFSTADNMMHAIRLVATSGDVSIHTLSVSGD